MGGGWGGLGGIEDNLGGLEELDSSQYGVRSVAPRTSGGGGYQQSYAKRESPNKHY